MGTRTRSLAWIFYALLTVAAVGAACSGPIWLLAVAALLGAYSVYLLRGGRFVVWFF